MNVPTQAWWIDTPEGQRLLDVFPARDDADRKAMAASCRNPEQELRGRLLAELLFSHREPTAREQAEYRLEKIREAIRVAGSHAGLTSLLRPAEQLALQELEACQAEA